jgi:RNA exonuclease 1
MSRNRERIISAPVLRLHEELNLTNTSLSEFLRHYILSPDQLVQLGYPVESLLYPGQAIIYKDPAAFIRFQRRTISSHLNVYAKEFVPLRAKENFQKESHGLNIASSTSNIMETEHPHLDNTSIGIKGNIDKDGKFEGDENTYSRNGACLYGCQMICEGGRCKAACSDSTGKLQNTTKVRETKSSNGTLKNKGQGQQLSGTDEKKCARCGRGFFLTVNGKYVTQEQCVYHWGKLEKAVAPQPNKVCAVTINRVYSCCGGNSSVGGCTIGKLHVWNGVGPGMNGPLDGYVRTRVRETFPPDGNYGIYALDCEMCYTTHGMELLRVTVVAANGRLVYDSFVRPENYIIDYNTRFSGITASDLNEHATKTLQDVQNDLMGFINADTILVGHGLETDLRVLRMIHGKVIDTSIIFPHSNGLPYRHSLKLLVRYILDRDIQQGSSGHCSFEDAAACMELILSRIRSEFGNIFQGGVSYFGSSRINMCY